MPVDGAESTRWSVQEYVEAFSSDTPVMPPLGNIAQRVSVNAGLDVDEARGAMTVAVVDVIPDCDRCEDLARFDMADRSTGIWLNACVAHARKLGLERLGSGLGAYLMTPSEVPPEVFDRVFLNDLADLWSQSVSDVRWVRVLHGLGFGNTESGLMGRVCGRATVRVERVGGLLRLVATQRDPEFLSLRTGRQIAVPGDISETLLRYVMQVLLNEYREPEDPLLKIPVHVCEQVVRDALATKNWPRRLWDELGGDNALLPGLLMGTAIAGYRSPSSIRWAAGQVAKTSRDDDLLTQLCLRGGDVTTAVDAAENENLTPAGMKRVIANAAPAVIEALVKRHDVPLEVVETAALRTLVDVTHIGSVYALLANPATPAAHVPALIERVWLMGGDDRAYVASLVRDLDADRRHTIWEGLLARSRSGKATSEMLKVMLWSDGTAAETMDAQTVDHTEMNWLTTGTHPRVQRFVRGWLEDNGLVERGTEGSNAATDGLGEEGAPGGYGRSALDDVAIAVRLRRAWVEEVGPFLDDVDHDLARLWPATHLQRRGLVLDLGTPVDFGLGDPFGDGVGETILRMLGSATHGAIRDLTWHHNAAMGRPTRQKAGRLDVFAPGDPVDMKLEQASAAISKRLRVENEAAAEALGGLRVAAVGRHMVWLAATDDRAAKAIGTTPGAASGLYEAVRKWQKATPKYCTYADESIAANSPALQPTF